MIIDVQFEKESFFLDTAIERKNEEILVDFGNISLIDTESTYYDGSYIVTPKVTPQVLSTAEKKMADDLTVKEIPYYEVSNQANGKTIIIGG